MKFPAIKSLQFRLAIRLFGLFLAISVFGALTLNYMTMELADSLNREELDNLAENIAEIYEENLLANIATVNLLQNLHESDTLFAIRSRSGEIIDSSSPLIAEIAKQRPVPQTRRSFFSLEIGEPPETYQAVEVAERTMQGPIFAIVAEPYDPQSALVSELLSDVSFGALLLVPLFVLITLFVGIYAIRSGLRPLLETSEQISKIQPESMSVRLGTKNIPSEITPLVVGINNALDRLEQGFKQQKEFIANAAHELRTPLTIITGAIENQEGSQDLTTLKNDIARMNRLVEQLLQAERLDHASNIEIKNELDLVSCTRELVESMAPLAISKNRELAFSDNKEPVIINGNKYLIMDALRNLIENALTYTPEGTEVYVEVHSDVRISVTDKGPGVSVEEKEQIFNRFWRGKKSERGGSGLGLSIVKEIMKIHHGSVSVSDSQKGGAVFILNFS